MKTASPQTLLDAIRFFSDPDVCLNFMVAIRWPNGVTCPTCGSKKVSFLSTRRLWKCSVNHDRRQFSVKVGSIFEDSPIGLDKWFTAMWIVANCKDGISSYEIARDLDVTQKTAWFMNHRIRRAMDTGSFEKMKGEVEADETFIRVHARFTHKDKKARITGTGGMGKVAVMSLLERHGNDETSQVRTKVLGNVQRSTLHRHIRENVEPGSDIFHRCLGCYTGIDSE